GVATAIDPPPLQPRETMPLPVTPLPPLATAAASNDEVARPLGSAEPATNPKLDVGVDQVGGYVCRLVGFVSAKFCADYISVRYFILLLIGLALVSGIAMVRLGPTLKGNGRSTSLLLSEPSNHASDVKELSDLQNSSVIVAALQKPDLEQGG